MYRLVGSKSKLIIQITISWENGVSSVYPINSMCKIKQYPTIMQTILFELCIVYGLKIFLFWHWKSWTENKKKIVDASIHVRMRLKMDSQERDGNDNLMIHNIVSKSRQKTCQVSAIRQSKIGIENPSIRTKSFHVQIYSQNL
jgi:hypothetical protein